MQAHAAIGDHARTFLNAVQNTRQPPERIRDAIHDVAGNNAENTLAYEA